MSTVWSNDISGPLEMIMTVPSPVPCGRRHITREKGGNLKARRKREELGVMHVALLHTQCQPPAHTPLSCYVQNRILTRNTSGKGLTTTLTRWDANEHWVDKIDMRLDGIREQTIKMNIDSICMRHFFSTGNH